MTQGADGDKTVQMALADPERFVLKPQLEGGGKASNMAQSLIKNTWSDLIWYICFRLFKGCITLSTG